jgi:hypothetical protein
MITHDSRIDRNKLVKVGNDKIEWKEGDYSRALGRGKV